MACSSVVFVIVTNVVTVLTHHLDVWLQARALRMRQAVESRDMTDEEWETFARRFNEKFVARLVKPPQMLR